MMAMPRPSYFLKQTCTITLATRTQDTYGAPESTAGLEYSCPCTLQPAQSNVGFNGHRMASTTGYDLYLDLISTLVEGGTVTATSGLMTKDTQYTVDDVNYEAAGEGVNPCSYNGAIVVNVERVK